MRCFLELKKKAGEGGGEEGEEEAATARF